MEPRLALPEPEEELEEDEEVEDELDEADDVAEAPSVRVTREAKEIKLGKKIIKRFLAQPALYQIQRV